MNRIHEQSDKDEEQGHVLVVGEFMPSFIFCWHIAPTLNRRKSPVRRRWEEITLYILYIMFVLRNNFFFKKKKNFFFVNAESRPLDEDGTNIFLLASIPCGFN